MRDCIRKRRNVEIVLAIAVGVILYSVGVLQGSSPDALVTQTTSASPAGEPARSGVCEGEAEKLIGHKPIRIGRSVRAPKKLRDVSPKYPEHCCHLARVPLTRSI